MENGKRKMKDETQTLHRESNRRDEPDLDSLPKAKMKFVEPMLAKLVKQVPDGKAWQYEVKLDGYRALAIKSGGHVTMFSRRGNVLNGRFPKIARSFGFLPDNTIIDGEVIALDDDGKPSFAALQKRERGQPLYFYVFDVLAYKGKDVRKVPLSERRNLLENYVLDEARDPIRLSTVFSANAHELIKAARAQGLEGIVAKRTDSIYESGERSGAWLKYKTDKSQELVIGGYKPGSNTFDYLLAGYYEGKKLMFVGKIKNGFTPVLRRKVAEQFRGLETDVCPFANLPEQKNARRGEALTAEVMAKCKWLKPKLVAHIEFTEWTEDNHLRHSRFAGLRDDKDPRDVTHDVAA